MTVQRGYLDYVRDIVAMMDKIETFTTGLDFDAFVRDDRLGDGYSTHPNVETVGSTGA